MDYRYSLQAKNPWHGYPVRRYHSVQKGQRPYASYNPRTAFSIFNNDSIAIRDCGHIHINQPEGFGLAYEAIKALGTEAKARESTDSQPKSYA